MITPAEVVQQWLPHKHKPASKGWILANAICCHHRGHRPDTRQRGNWLIDANGHVSYKCWNCAFSARYTGDGLTDSFVKFLTWMNVPQETIQELKIYQLQKDLDGTVEQTTIVQQMATQFVPEPLPPGSQSFAKLAHSNDPDYALVKQYIQSRGPAVARNWEYYWAPAGKWGMKNRAIIPFYDVRLRQIGWSARWAGTPPRGIPRYLNSSLPPDYLFNPQAMYAQRRWVIIVEGVLDAVSIDCVAVMSHQMSQGQIAQIIQSGLEPILLPDRERTNQDLIDQANELGWQVSFPEWETKIKDAADATRAYGEIYTLRSILASRTNNKLKIDVLRKRLGE